MHCTRECSTVYTEIYERKTKAKANIHKHCQQASTRYSIMYTLVARCTHSFSQSEQHKSKHTYVQHTNHICDASLDAKYANAQDSIKSSTHIIKRLEHDKKSKRLLCLHRCSLRHHSAKCTSICTNTPHKSRGKYYLICLHSHRASKKNQTNHTFNHIFHPHRAYATPTHFTCTNSHTPLLV